MINVNMGKICEPIVGDKVKFIKATREGKYIPDKKILGTLINKYSNVYEVKTSKGIYNYQQGSLTGANCSKKHRELAKKRNIKKLKRMGVVATNRWY